MTATLSKRLAELRREHPDTPEVVLLATLAHDPEVAGDAQEELAARTKRDVEGKRRAVEDAIRRERMHHLIGGLGLMSDLEIEQVRRRAVRSYERSRHRIE